MIAPRALIKVADVFPKKSEKPPLADSSAILTSLLDRVR